jgi:hypothetical protein
MTKPTLTVSQTAPTEDDIAEFVQDLGTRDDGRYAYAAGYLGSLIGTLANQHHRCRRRNCLTCDGLRRGLALVTALDRVDHVSLGGVR